MTGKKRDHTIRMAIVALLFAIICVIYCARLINLQVSGRDLYSTEYSGKYYKRTVTVQALRGEIFDRNGKKLVSNSYTYNFIFDYGSYPDGRRESNDAILKALLCLEEYHVSNLRAKDYFPFDGVYPDLYFTADAINEGNAVSSKLATYKRNNSIESDEAADLIEYIVKKFELDITEGSGKDKKNVYTNEEITELIRVHYDMDVKDFGFYVPYVIANGVDISFITYVKETGVVGTGFYVSAERVYNYPGYASHILGNVGQIQEEDWDYYNSLGYPMNSIVGISGCEKVFENYLHGEDGMMTITEDEYGNIIDEKIIKEPIPGNDVYLTIDIDLQIAAEKALAEGVRYVSEDYNSGEGTLTGEDCNSGAVTVNDPNTGEVLAIASYPTYDLSTLSEDYSTLINNKASPLYNRALDGIYAPGSTFKVGVAAMALTEGVISPETIIRCDGIYTHFKDYQPRCWYYLMYGLKHGDLNVESAIAASCNCFFFEVGRLLGIETMNRYCELYGFGQETGIELGGSTGILAGPIYRELNNLPVWTAGDTITAAIGQSNNAFSPMQIGVYASMMANGGTRYSAHLLCKVKTFGGEEIYSSEPEILSRVDFSDETVAIYKEGMRRVVLETSALKKFFADVPVTVCAKTGTAQLGSGSDNGVFICFAPLESPEIAISCVLEHASSGSNAGYVASLILEYYYGVK